MKNPSFNTRALVAGIAFVVPLIFAAITHHEFEDYLITLQSSKNLADGNGLVYHVGERVHTFTSPLGVLVPAAIARITGNHSDLAILWIFRILGAALLSVSAALVYDLLRKQEAKGLVIFAVMGLLLTDVKTIDFTINGMETGFLVTATVLMLYAWLAAARFQGLLLAIAWAGLMWSRPDGFVYAGSFAFACVAFGVGSGGERRPRLAVLRQMAFAAGLSIALYLPWLIFAWAYYGSPVPNTVLAKGLAADRSVVHLLAQTASFPLAALSDALSISSCLMPVYVWLGGWPDWMTALLRLVTLLGIFHWLVPFASRTGRAVSLCACLAHLYLSALAPTLAPWYLPPATWLTVLSLGFFLGAMLARLRPVGADAKAFSWRATPRTALVVVLLVGLSSYLLTASARQLSLHQDIIETGHRRQIGEWLKENSSPGDTVFMECLGYIGYYSGLKTLDFPGLSSREVLEARLAAGPMGERISAALIRILKPDWLVLRPHEVNRVLEDDAGLLKEDYKAVKDADVSKRVDEATFLPGRGYLRYDQRFIIFRRVE